MDVFAITCQKHICYVKANEAGDAYCPGANMLPEVTDCDRHDWHIFQSDNHMMNLTEHVRTAVHDLNGIVNRLNNNIKPKI